jgi:hypothetical protein
LPASGASDSSADEEGKVDTSGWPRSIRIELQWAKSRSSGFSTGGSGLGLRGTLDTPNLGALSVDGQLGGKQRFSNSRNDDSRAVALTLTQLGMPLANGWQVNNTLGIVAPSQVPLARSQQRIGLPARSLEGAATEFISANGAVATASIGNVGQLEGYPAARFRKTDGTWASVGGQFQMSANDQSFTTAANTVSVRGAPNELGLFAAPDAVPVAKADFDSLFFAERYRRGDFELQGNLVRSRSIANGQQRNANGFWLDAQQNIGRSRHGAGLFYLQPNLNWGGLAMNSDVEGGYYRFTHSTLRWTTDLSAEALRSVSGVTPSGGFASGSLAYRLSRDVSIGGGAAYREFAGRGVQVYGYVQSKNGVGTGRAQLDVTEATTGERAQSLALDQSFETVPGLRLSTSLSLSNQQAKDFKRQTVSVSFAGGYEFFDSLSLDVNVQSRNTISGPIDNALYGTFGLAWRFNRNWSLNANAVVGRGRFDTGVILDPLAPPTIVTNRPSQRSFQIAVRYEDRAGSIIAPIGGRVGGGGAAVTGVVFLDANSNGIADASEVGVANLAVLLDGKFSARTDAQGRYEFPFVGAGEHTLSIISDNLPLPWSVVNDGITRFKVSPRDTVRLNIPAVKSL